MIKWTGLAPWEFEFPFPVNHTPGTLNMKVIYKRVARMCLSLWCRQELVSCPPPLLTTRPVGSRLSDVSPRKISRDSRSEIRVRETRSETREISPDGKDPMVVLEGGRFLMREVPLYGTDPSEMRCLSLQGYLASKKRTPPPRTTVGP